MAVLLAMYLCVPETNQFAMAALIPMAVFLVELVRREQLGVEWYALAAASVAWAGMFGSSGRQSALIGALFSWWPILLPWLIGRLMGARQRTTVIASMVVGALAAVVFARTGGISASGVTAAVVVAAIAAASCAAVWIFAASAVRVRALKR